MINETIDSKSLTLSPHGLDSSGGVRAVHIKCSGHEFEFYVSLLFSIKLTEG